MFINRHAFYFILLVVQAFWVYRSIAHLSSYLSFLSFLFCQKTLSHVWLVYVINVFSLPKHNSCHEACALCSGGGKSCCISYHTQYTVYVIINVVCLDIKLSTPPPPQGIYGLIKSSSINSLKYCKYSQILF